MASGQPVTELFGIDLPIIQAPMAGSSDHELLIAVSEAGGLGSLPCAMLTPDEVRASVAAVRARTPRPFNLNFFCHQQPAPRADRDTRWLERLKPFYAELGLDPSAPFNAPLRTPFDAAMCDVVVELRPSVVSFHFGLPSDALLERVRATGARLVSSATTVAEARWLEDRGCDAVIAQGAEGGGHRGMFLVTDAGGQVGTMALLPQVVDAVRIPVIAAGGIADARGIVAAMALGAAGVQIGTAYLRCPEAKTSAVHRRALESARDDSTVITNVITGRPARGIVNRIIHEMGPLDDLAPEFPQAAVALAPLRASAERQGAGDFSPLWAGQAASLAREVSAFELTRALAAEARSLIERLAGG